MRMEYRSHPAKLSLPRRLSQLSLGFNTRLFRESVRLNRILSKTYLETTVDGTIVRHQIPFLVGIEIHLGKQVN